MQSIVKSFLILGVSKIPRSRDQALRISIFCNSKVDWKWLCAYQTLGELIMSGLTFLARHTSLYTLRFTVFISHYKDLNSRQKQWIRLEGTTLPKAFPLSSFLGMFLFTTPPFLTCSQWLLLDIWNKQVNIKIRISPSGLLLLRQKQIKKVPCMVQKMRGTVSCLYFCVWVLHSEACGVVFHRETY